ncbi:hypothetical protein [Kribbella deserti]|uniref:LppP/LprE family lipoprotein n=1 Tax=Kribbella deserti TaxID=1926257 RepID=A0ABV6QJE0_9ACTN
MSDNELRQALRELPEHGTPLDPARVIAGAHRRRRNRRATAAGVASAAVVAVVAVVAFGSGTPGAEPGPAENPTIRTNQTPSPDESAGARAAERAQAKAAAMAKQAVADCRSELGQYADPQALPKLTGSPVANVLGPVGSTVIFADTRAWVACDDSWPVTGSGKPSVLQAGTRSRPSPSDVNAFAVSGIAVTVKGKLYNYYWSAGRRPVGVAKVSYTFPGEITRVAQNVGDFWIVQYREAQPIPEGQTNLDRAKIQVRLLRADNSVLRTHSLTWGEQTCAHVNHGC